jgi:hypothetical protein
MEKAAIFSTPFSCDVVIGIACCTRVQLLTQLILRQIIGFLSPRLCVSGNVLGVYFQLIIIIFITF